MKEFFKYVLATVVGIIAVSIVGFFLMFIVVGAIVASTEKEVVVAENSMLLIDLSRTVVDRSANDPFEDLDLPPMFSQVKTIGLDQISESLEKATKDDRIKGVYLDLAMINGGMASVEEIRNALIAFKDSCDKPVYACADKGILGQKAYYLATVADKIVVHPEVSVDFRGLGGEMMFYKDALKKIGVEIEIVRHGKFKAAVEPFLLDKMSKENRLQTMSYMNSLWSHMLNGISEERGISVDELNKLADEVQSFRKGAVAVETGLVEFKELEQLNEHATFLELGPNKKTPPIYIILDISGEGGSNIRECKLGTRPNMMYKYIPGATDSNIAKMFGNLATSKDPYDTILMKDWAGIFLEDPTRTILIKEYPQI